MMRNANRFEIEPVVRSHSFKIYKIRLPGLAANFFHGLAAWLRRSCFGRQVSVVPRAGGSESSDPDEDLRELLKRIASGEATDRRMRKVPPGPPRLTCVSDDGFCTFGTQSRKAHLPSVTRAFGPAHRR